jgi:hypothetical protein
MPQLHLYVPEDLATEVTRRAKARGQSVSRYLAELVQAQVGTTWPNGYFDEVAGGWRGEPLSRASQGRLKLRDSL